MASTAALSVVGVQGFSRQVNLRSAFSLKRRTRSASVPVMNSTGNSGLLRKKCCAKVHPSISGISTSVISRSMLAPHLLNSSMASRGLVASRTAYPRCRSTVLKRRTTLESSSTSKIVFFTRHLFFSSPPPPRPRRPRNANFFADRAATKVP